MVRGCFIKEKGYERTLRKGGRKETESSEFSWPSSKVSFIKKVEMQLKI